MFSGKTAVGHIIRELDGFCVPDFELEFNLLRIQDGIIDLESNLVDNWSLIRSNNAILRFKRLIKKLDGTYSKFPYFLFHFHSDFYNTKFGNKFTELSNEYINNFVSSKWSCDWPYPMYDMPESLSFSKKIKKRLLKDDTAYESVFHLVDSKDFIFKTKKYLSKLLSSFEEVKEGTTTIVMNNAFEPFNPSKSLRYFDDAKCIVIRRDPRDMYVTGSKESSVFSKISHGNAVDNFILRYKLQEEHTNKEFNPRILYLQYEDVVLNYENTLKKIFKFLEIDESLHIKKKEFFKPEDSKRFIGIYKNYGNQDEIKLIEERLQAYCLDYI